MKKLLLFLCTLMLFFGVVGSANAVMFEGHDYVVVRYAGGTWDGATSDMIATLGSDYHLATITSQEEQNFIQSVLLSGLSGQYWLGGEQVPNNELDNDASWYWVNNEGMFWDNGPISGMYANWAAGEPNDNYGAGSEQYLAMWSSYEWRWNDEQNLGNISGYIAESAPVPEPATILLLATGLFGIAGVGRKKMLKK